MSIKYFKISLPTDQGFLGQKCPSKACGRYFKIEKDLVGKIYYCPYCGVEIRDKELFTEEQKKYIEEKAIRKSTEYAIKEFQKILEKTFKGSDIFKYKSTKIKWGGYRPKSLKEKEVDSEIVCPKCNARFQVYGIFGYCPVCRTENILIYDANLEIIRRKIKNAKDQHQALRYVYNDLVSTFEFMCANVSKKHGLLSIKFQSITDTRKHFLNSSLKIDIFKGVTESEQQKLREIFQKRHILEHNKGIINERYKKMVPYDNAEIGTKVSLSLDEFEDAAIILRKVLGNLI